MQPSSRQLETGSDEIIQDPLLRAQVKGSYIRGSNYLSLDRTTRSFGI